MTQKLFTPLKVGAITVPNRVFRAPMTRLRCIEPGDILTPLMTDYLLRPACFPCFCIRSSSEKDHDFL
ncbi:hypothetical protein [Pseudomonas sp. MWU13-2100]|uniref:oxidoreductase n=1 Tax=Pseudomonas sp. MWU13-2100 TaxID=2935075 RepID=UPI00298BFB83|nr:hypothetical protein [Pseudomonas sp. MWU13-2100]